LQQPNKLLKRFQDLLIVICIVISSIIVILPIKIVSILLPVYLGIALIALLFMLVESILYLKQKSTNQIFAIFCIIFSCFLIFSFTFTKKNYHFFNINITDIGLFAAVLLFTFSLSQNISDTFKHVEGVSSELEKEVIHRTYQLNKTIEKLRFLSFTDELTGIYNLRKFIELGEREVSIHQRHKRSLSLILFDIDSFKSINDTYGHKTGDKALKFLTSTCRQEIRGSDILGRIGGDEFALLLLETSNEKASTVAEELRHTIQETSKISTEVPGFTVSMGVVTFRRTEILDIARQRADVCLYKAKNMGRNRVYTQSNKNTSDLDNENPPELLEEVDDT
jgi:diguanylate cyclase (GGDEF)-like protein